jgi:probable rRNA maturation factor
LITIEIANFYPNLSFEEEKVRSFFKRIFLLHDHNVSGVLSIAFLNKLAHSKIHGEFLQDFRPTDVITFPADPDNELIGEICVSVDQAIEEVIPPRIAV